MQKYNLMHKNAKIGLLKYNETAGRIVDYKNFGTGHSPFSGTVDMPKIKKMVGD